MATKHFDFVAGKDKVTVSKEGTELAIIRYHFSKIYQVELRKKISSHDSYLILCHVYLLSNLEAGERAMSFDAARALPQQEVNEELRRRDIAVVRVAFNDLTEALAAVLKSVGQQFLTVRVLPHAFKYRDHVHLVFDLHSKDEFMLWRSEWIPNPEIENLHIVPDYHPCMNGKKPIHMINGDTDHRVRGYAVVRIESPLEARANIEEGVAGSTWTHLQHPYRAKGRSIALTVRTGLLRSKDGVRELARFLRAVLGKTDEYVEVSGGFQAPLLHAHNLLIQKGIPSPAEGKRFGQWTRGCEEFNVWAYRTLLAEGKLEGAYVPEWFLEEGWLDIYAGSPEKPGLF